jgi:hypothetical protein
VLALAMAATASSQEIRIQFVEPVEIARKAPAA